MKRFHSTLQLSDSIDTSFSAMRGSILIRVILQHFSFSVQHTEKLKCCTLKSTDIEPRVALKLVSIESESVIPPPTGGNFSFRSAAFRCTVFKTRKETATNTVRTIGQAFDVVHRIVEAEKDQNNNLDNLDAAETEKEIVFSPRKSIKSNKVMIHFKGSCPS